MLAGLLVCVHSAGPVLAFERGSQAQYDQFAQCYGQQVGAANALADDHEHWRAAYPNPDAKTAEEIGMVQAHAVQMSTMAETSAALYEDLDHPGYGIDMVAANKAYAAGYAVWETYMATPFDNRVALKLTEDMMGMSPDCWRATFALEAMNAANAAAGELVWPD
jgi:hypothetical protein